MLLRSLYRLSSAVARLKTTHGFSNPLARDVLSIAFILIPTSRLNFSKTSATTSTQPYRDTIPIEAFLTEEATCSTAHQAAVRQALRMHVAGNFGLRLYTLSLKQIGMTDSMLLKLMQELSPGCLLLMEDVDCAGLDRELGPLHGTLEPKSEDAGSNRIRSFQIRLKLCQPCENSLERIKALDKLKVEASNNPEMLTQLECLKMQELTKHLEQEKAEKKSTTAFTKNNNQREKEIP